MEFRFALRTKLFCRFLVLWLTLSVHVLIHFPVSMVFLLLSSLANYCWQLIVWFYLVAGMTVPIFQSTTKLQLFLWTLYLPFAARISVPSFCLLQSHGWAKIPVYLASSPWVCLDIWANYSCLFDIKCDFCILVRAWKPWLALSNVYELDGKLGVESKSYCWICSSFRNNNKKYPEEAKLNRNPKESAFACILTRQCAKQRYCKKLAHHC